MKNIFLTFVTMLCGFAGCTAQTEKFTSVDVAEFEKVASDTNHILLDVRTADEYGEGHLSGAINVDVLRDDFLAQASHMCPKKRRWHFIAGAESAARKRQGYLPTMAIR